MIFMTFVHHGPWTLKGNIQKGHYELVLDIQRVLLNMNSLCSDIDKSCIFIVYGSVAASMHAIPISTRALNSTVL